MIYTYNPFGYEGSLVTVEVDIRRGIPAIDIVGLADGAVKESRERLMAAIKNSGFEFPNERVLISLSPADLKKEGSSFDLPMALAVLSAKDDYPRSQDANVLVMGEVELSGNIRPVRAIYPALCKAVESGIKYAIVPEDCETATPDGITVFYVKNLEEAYWQLTRIDENEVYGDESESEKTEELEMKAEFDEINKEEGSLDDISGMNGLKYAMAVAAAGGHHLLAWGKQGCGKTLALQHFPELLPHLTKEESESVTRIHSIAGLLNPNQEFMKTRPFRMPHQTASIEGMCGGGVNCRPGEISLAHNGTLFLDDAAEFRSGVLQMLRVPLESKAITLSRAGRCTTYPAHFQLLMTANPCPCGNYGSKDKICLCSAKSVERYWAKFSGPLLDRVAIRYNCNEPLSYADMTLKGLREMIARARERQYARQGKLNNDLTPQEIEEHIKLGERETKWLFTETVRHDYSPRAISQIKRLAQTIADMHNRNDNEPVSVDDLKTAMELRANTPDVALYN